MPLSVWYRVSVLALMLLGAFVALWGPLLVRLLAGSPGAQFPAADSADATARLIWSSLALLRLLGVALFGLAMVLWSLRGSLHIETNRRVGLSLFAALVLMLVMAALQQKAIWSNPVGAGVSAVVVLLLAVGVFPQASRAA